MIPGRPLRWMATPPTSVDGQNPAYRPTHRTADTEPRSGRSRLRPPDAWAAAQALELGTAEMRHVIESAERHSFATDFNLGDLSLGDVEVPRDLIVDIEHPPHCSLDW